MVIDRIPCFLPGPNKASVRGHGIIQSPQELGREAERGARYILLHHANSADRETLSKWLKAHSGTEVQFTFQNKEYKGILCRLANCFGRGLLIYTADVRPVKRDIIDVILPLVP